MLKAQWVSLSLRNPGGGRMNGNGNGYGAGMGEVSYHLLHQTSHVRLAAEPGFQLTEQRGAQQADYSAGVVAGGAADSYASLPAMQRKIMQVVGANDTDEGMHVSAITKAVGGNNSEEVMCVFCLSNSYAIHMWYLAQPRLPALLSGSTDLTGTPSRRS